MGSFTQGLTGMVGSISKATDIKKYVDERQAKSAFNNSMADAKKTYDDGVAALGSDLTAGERESRLSALESQRAEAERNAYIQKDGNADGFINHQKAIREGNTTERDNMSLRAQREGVRQQLLKDEALRISEAMSKLGTDGRAQLAATMSDYYYDVSGGAKFVANQDGTYSRVNADGTSAQISANDMMGLAQNLANDRRNIEQTMTILGLAGGDMKPYHDDQEALSDRKTENVKRRTEYHKGSLYKQGAAVKGTEAQAGRATPDGGAYVQNEEGDVVAEKDSEGRNKSLAVSTEKHNAIMKSLGEQLADAYANKTLKEAAVVDFGYSDKEGAYGVKVKTNKGIIFVPDGKLGEVFKPKNGTSAISTTSSGKTWNVSKDRQEKNKKLLDKSASKPASEPNQGIFYKLGTGAIKTANTYLDDYKREQE